MKKYIIRPFDNSAYCLTDEKEKEEVRYMIAEVRDKDINEVTEYEIYDYLMSCYEDDLDNVNLMLKNVMPTPKYGILLKYPHLSPRDYRDLYATARDWYTAIYDRLYTEDIESVYEDNGIVYIYTHTDVSWEARELTKLGAEVMEYIDCDSVAEYYDTASLEDLLYDIPEVSKDINLNMTYDEICEVMFNNNKYTKNTNLYNQIFNY